MAKRRSHTTIRVADGAGGLVEVVDHRFDQAEWPIRFSVPADQADRWFAHLGAECAERGWSSHGVSQLDAAENSGSKTITTGIAGQSSALEIAWERRRGGPLAVRARPAGTPAMSLEAAQAFIDAVHTRSQAETTIRQHRRGHLVYEGLPWHGELWLGNDLRLGPPSRHASSLVAPQVIIVDAEVNGIGPQGVTSAFDLLLRELSIFLTVVIGIKAGVERSGIAWTYEFDAAGKAGNCDLRPLGYLEASGPQGMPQPGAARPIPLRQVQRPGLEPPGISTEDTEQAVPHDTADLWQQFRALPPDLRDQFLRAGNAYRIARSMWPDQQTAYLAFLVVACEALKPAGEAYDDCNIYDVVEGLLGAAEAQQLRQLRLAPQRVRNRHLHRGELAAGELVPLLLESDFGNPTFHETATVLTRTTRTCLIEWLRQDGSYVVSQPRTKARGRRR